MEKTDNNNILNSFSTCILTIFVNKLQLNLSEQIINELKLEIEEQETNYFSLNHNKSKKIKCENNNLEEESNFIYNCPLDIWKVIINFIINEPFKKKNNY